jgi:teichuronic acid biosynthesis glycosyltransferase TuaC
MGLEKSDSLQFSANNQNKSPQGLKVLMVTSEWPNSSDMEWAPFLAEQVHFLRAAGVDVDIFHFQGRKNPIRYIIAWVALRLKHRFANYDLIHAQFGQAGLIALPSSIPLVVTFHGSDLQGYVSADGRYTLTGKILSIVSCFVSKKADQSIIVAEHLLKFLPKTSTVSVIPCGIDTQVFHPMSSSQARQQLNLPEKKTLVLFPSSPNRPEKRYHLAREACNIAMKTIDLEMIVLDGISHAHVPLYMNACDALIFTSIHEGSPTVIKEALACNLPIVSVDVGDVRERISDILNCVLCNDDSTETIAQGLLKVLIKRQRIADRTRIAELDWQIITAKIISVYKIILSKGTPPISSP